MKNRLKLDFTLKTNIERSEFVNKYLTEEQFQKSPPTEDELETIANYILWGADVKTGLNARQSKEIQLETRGGTWDASKADSLDALLEAPGFNESQLRRPNDPIIKQPRVVFSRDEARQEAPPHVLEKLEELWTHIDELDLTINYFDLKHNKRKLEPRAELLNRFTPARRQQIQESAEKLNQYQYLKMRHLLVELRREQFSLRDFYRPTIQIQETAILNERTTPIFDADVNVLPVGFKYESKQKLFPTDRFPCPQDFSEKEIEEIIKDYWKRKEFKGQSFDFRELEHIYLLFGMWDDIQDAAIENEVYSTLGQLIQTLEFYIARASLSEMHQEILNLKLRHFQNLEITQIVNPKYGKTYNANYISTIFRQHIIPQINNAARHHEEVVSNICFEENFKQCRGCGQILLIGTENFVRKARSNDGFSTQCKRCDKKKREARKERINAQTIYKTT